MKKREVIKILNCAFSELTPPIDVSALELCPEHEESRNITVKSKIKMSKALKIVLVATAVAALTVTAAAISFSGLIGEEKAIIVGKNYIVENETDGELKYLLEEAILKDIVYGENAERSEADIGLKEGRLIYKVSFKTCGYSYKLEVDAKTGVVYSCERSADPDWENVRESVAKEAEKEQEQKNLESMTFQDGDDALPKINYMYAAALFKDHFGLLDIEKVDSFNQTRNMVEGKYESVLSVDGYTYSAKVDFSTGEITEASVTETEGYDGERIKHEKSASKPSIDELLKNAEEAVANEYPEALDNGAEFSKITYYEKLDCIKDYEKAFSIVFGCTAKSVDASGISIMSGYNVVVIADSATGEILDVYKAHSNIEIVQELMKRIGAYSLKSFNFSNYNSTDKYGSTSDVLISAELHDHVSLKGIKATVNTVTLEITDVEIFDTLTTNFARNEIPSSEAPDGYISETAAASVALERSGVSQKSVNALKVRLEGEVYTVTFNFGVIDINDGAYHVNTYHINAKTGEIIDLDAITPEDYISAKEAEKLAFEEFKTLCGVYGIKNTDDAEVIKNELEASELCCPIYRISIKLGDITEEFIIDALSDSIV